MQRFREKIDRKTVRTRERNAENYFKKKDRIEKERQNISRQNEKKKTKREVGTKESKKAVAKRK